MPEPFTSELRLKSSSTSGQVRYHRLGIMRVSYDILGMKFLQRAALSDSGWEGWKVGRRIWDVASPCGLCNFFYLIHVVVDGLSGVLFQVSLPTADMECDLQQFADVVCGNGLIFSVGDIK